MKLLFIHGSNAIKEDTEGNYYTDGSYRDEVWQRYYNLANNLTVMTRKESNVYKVDIASKRFHFFDKKKYRFVEYTSDEIMEKEIMRADAIIIRVPSRVSYKAIDFAKKHRKKYLLEIVGCAFDVQWNLTGLNNKFKAIKNYLKLKMYAKEASYVLYVSNEFLQKRYPTDGNAIACSDVILECFEEDVLKTRIEYIKGKKETDSIVLCTVGSVDLKIKGQRYVIEAIAKLNKKGYNFKYCIVGGGDNTKLKEIVKKYKIEDAVEFTGMLPHSKVFDCMKKCDIYVQPSETEGLPRVMVEALSVAMPCIGSSAGGIPELIDSKYVFKSKNVGDLIKVLKKLDKDEMIKQAKKNYEMSKQFNSEILERKRKEFYNQLIS